MREAHARQESPALARRSLSAALGGQNDGIAAMTYKLLVLAVAAFVLLGANVANHAPGACLGSLCFDQSDRPQENPLVARFGPGHIANAGGAHCYLVDGGIFFMFNADSHREQDRELDWVYVGSRPWPGCDQSLPPNETVPYLSTPEGLHVGDSEGRLRDLYGRAPGFKVKKQGKSRVATFGPCAPDCALLETTVVIEGERVVSIMIANHE